MQPSAAATLPSTKILSPTLSERRTRRPIGAICCFAWSRPRCSAWHVRVEQLFLALVLLGEQLFDFLRVDVEQHRQRADDT